MTRDERVISLGENKAEILALHPPGRRGQAREERRVVMCATLCGNYTELLRCKCMPQLKWSGLKYFWNILTLYENIKYVNFEELLK